MFLGVDQIISLIESQSYLAIFLLMLGESIILPIPSEVVLPFTGFLIAIGAINPVFGFLDAVIAAVLGNWIGYAIGYVFGIDVVLKYGSKFGYKMKDYSLGIKWIKKYGNYFAFITKVLPVVRSVSGMICGAFKMKFSKFTFYTTLGICLWSAALIYAGYSLSSNWTEIASALSNPIIYYASGVVIIGILVYIFRKTIAKWAQKMATVLGLKKRGQ